MKFGELNREENQAVEERFGLAFERISQIPEEESVDEKYRDFFSDASSFLCRIKDLLTNLSDGSFEKMDFDARKAYCDEFFTDVLEENYQTSYANPTYASEKCSEYGKYLSVLMVKIRSTYGFAFQNRLTEIVVIAELFLEIYTIFESDELSEESVKDALYWFESDYQDLFMAYGIRSMFDDSITGYVDIVTKSDLSDLKYLYEYGFFISENEIGTAKFLNRATEADIESMARTCVDGFVRGFELAGKDLTIKETVDIYYNIGFERMVKKIIELLSKLNLRPIIRAAGISATPVNKQYIFDHKFDIGIYLDKRFNDRRLTVAKVSFEKMKEYADKKAGPIAIETFGENPFSPENKPESIRLNERQSKLFSKYQTNYSSLYHEYVNGEETSFTIIAYPIPEIGENYEKLFAETVKINTLDPEVYEKIQTEIINVLDKAEYVRVLGKGNNSTDMKVMMHSLRNPEKETLFENCLADVNIPLGEVFTSPRLTGTNGVLNVSEVYLNSLKFKNLTITFKDGMVTDYTCNNFDSEEENKRFVRENVLSNHETLPIGEFAIGTNTTAYVIGKQYDIVYKLPILIVEKMGPHFAVGDTCYSFEEDSKTYNPDKKEIVAKENECSALRKTDISKAYFGCHLDITIPYEELLDISAYTSEGEKITIIHDGRFVLEGTEKLNEPLEQLG